MNRVFTIFSYFRVNFCEFLGHRVVLTHAGGCFGPVVAQEMPKNVKNRLFTFLVVF